MNADKRIENKKNLPRSVHKNIVCAMDIQDSVFGFYPCKSVCIRGSKRP